MKNDKLLGSLLTTIFFLCGNASAYQDVESIAKQKNCFVCHQQTTKLLGPSFSDMRERYTFDQQTSAQLVAAIREGSRGRWGAVPMPKHPNVSESDAQALVKWILRTPADGGTRLASGKQPYSDSLEADMTIGKASVSSEQSINDATINKADTSAGTSSSNRRQCSKMRLDIARKYANLLDPSRAREELNLFQGPCASEPDAQEKIRFNTQLLSSRSVSNAPAKLTVQECFQKIVAIHQRGDVELNAARGNPASEETARNRSRQGQLDLFAGECSHHPEASNYVAQAREQLSSSSATISRSSSERAGGSGTGPQSRGTSSKIIAGDGKSAVDCVRLVEMASADSRLGGGRRALVNNCGGPVEISWCYVATECAHGRGNNWSLGVGRSWPIKHDEVRWGACHGANTISAEEGTAGLRYICSAPRK